MEKRYLNLKDLCEYVGLKASQIYWLVHTNKIPFGHITDSQKSPLIFIKDEIDRWVHSHSTTFEDIKRS